MRRILAIALLASGCREEVHELQLVLGAAGGKGVSDGLVCPLEDGSYLIASLWNDPDRGGCMVVDVVPTNGSPGCRLSELSFACTKDSCVPDTQYRVTLPLDGEPPQMTSAGILMWIRNRLRDKVVFDDAPDTLAILRATIVRSDCGSVSDIDPQFACSDVVGCVYSCPISIGDVDGQITLDLDSLSQSACIRDVRLCASDHMFDRDPTEMPCDTDPLMP